MTGPRIHPTAIISRDAEIASDVEIGAYAIVGDNCNIANGCVISPRVTLERNVALSQNVKVGVGTILGGPPQDLKFAGEETTVEIGEGTVIREYTTINRGTAHSFKTTVGQNCLLMSYVHLAHDCHVGDNVILSNVVQLAGHVTVEDRAIISGLSAAHQFVRIGRQSFIGGCSRVSKDIPPFLRAVGNPVKLYGLNTIGLQRSGMDEATIRELKRAYRLLFRSDLNVTQAIERAQNELEPLPEVKELLRFVEGSERGVVI
ncbi:MAG: acyl-[acyl-carrier-protein]--UDP-N-acetylglucosamine O-acyltransferase [Gemmatimonadetes bacterium]|nr:MAG: acyl-[acyl-carrier-protein]--UDP-N-acetylglucosamine O-acyltransferase [Gemmatimonadota bacterium]